MTSSRKYVLCAIASVGAAGLVGLAGVSAASTTSSTGSLANKIATQFHLNQSDVQKTIDSYRGDKRAANETKYEDKLSAAVTAGTITAAQKTAILAKQTELENVITANKGKDAATRKAAVTAELKSIKQWATDNKIPADFIRPFERHRRMGMSTTSNQ